MLDRRMSASPVDPLHRVSGPDTAWTRVNIAEGIPGVSTPLNWSWWDDANDAMVLGAYCDIGVLPAVEIPPASAVDQRTSAIFYGRPALNVDVSRRMADLQPGTSGEALERHYFGAVRPDAPSHASVRRYPAIALKLPFLWRRIPGQLQASTTTAMPGGSKPLRRALSTMKPLPRESWPRRIGAFVGWHGPTVPWRYLPERSPSR